MKKKNGGWFVIFAVAAVIALAVYASYLVNGDFGNEESVYENPPAEEVFGSGGLDSAVSSGSNGGSGDFYAAFRAERDSVRAREMEYLDAIALDQATDAETRKQAQQQKLELIACMEKEVTIEGVLKARGFSQVAVTVHKGSVNIVVDGPLQQDAVAQILDIARRETGERAENIKILPRS